ncbi:MFS general substrate transporter [Hyaloscypha variabilis F]|uniref:MFS general substrate transporter n=1 Tax=Hyaloscypha variabilis (strain UAMH 11265 / GT02V1 / F) TaxID=1149755 RepID=A0A2J6RCW5_HYAVF|nr:MFS general substrate transporter [Hyaloscypha variabilis F]
MTSTINPDRPVPINEKAGPEHTYHAESSHVEHIPGDKDDNAPFVWNYDVVTNLLALYLTYFSSTWALTIPSTSIAFIMYEFPGDYSTVGWIAGVPGLILCVVQIFLGDVSDLFGRRRFVLAGTILGTAGMIIGGRGTSISMIVAGQVLNGLALTLGYLSTPLMAEAVPKRWRGPVIGVGTGLGGIAAIAGGLSQGAYMKYHVGGTYKGWRVGFYLGSVFFFLSFVTLVLFYHPSPRPIPEGMSTQRRLLKIDWSGIFLGTSGLLFLLLRLQYGGSSPWDSPRVLAFLAVGGVVTLIFIAWEWKGVGPEDGLFPASLFVHRNYAVTLALSFMEGMVMFSSQAFLPQMILALLTTDFVMSAVYNLPSIGGALLGALSTSIILAKTKEAKWITMFGMAMLAAGGGLLAVIQPGITLAACFFPSILLGFGMGSLGTAIPVIATLCTPNQFVATSVAVGSSVRGLGGAIGTVVFTTIYSSKLTEFLPAKVGLAVIQAGLPPASVGPLLQAAATRNPELIASVPGVTPQVMAALQSSTAQAYADAFRFIWYALIPFSVITLVICAFLHTTKEQMTLQVAAAVQHRHKDHHTESKLEEGD